MKESMRPAAPARAASSSAGEKRKSNRITLALLDEYTAGHETRGYDPYNAGNGSRTIDAWRTKSKRM